VTTATLDKEEAREELGKFLQLASDLGPGLKMFSNFIDHEWHTLLQDPAAYKAFCAEKRTIVWEHSPNVAPAIAVIEWIGEYESRWGDLSAAWFANTDGSIDQDAYQDYLDSHKVVAAWDCNPSTGSVARVAAATDDAPSASA
jgi:hypothetical protein